MIGYLDKIWSSLNKPKGKENCSIDDFFDFAFAGLPHKIFARDSFESSVSKLRSRFIDSKSAEYVFLPNYHKRIPADGFPHFAEGIWSRILSNRDLDLPTQTQLLAQHRCDEIAGEVYIDFFKDVQYLKSPLAEGQVPENFGVTINKSVSKAISTCTLIIYPYSFH